MNDKVVTNVKAEVMNISGANRAFYRIYILPNHIARREGEMKEALKKELAGHRKFVRDNNLGDELDLYIAAQQDRQAKYDAWQEAKAAFAVTRADDTLSFRERADAEELVEAAEAAFTEAKEAFKAKYH